MISNWETFSGADVLSDVRAGKALTIRPIVATLCRQLPPEVPPCVAKMLTEPTESES